MNRRLLFRFTFALVATLLLLQQVPASLPLLAVRHNPHPWKAVRLPSEPLFPNPVKQNKSRPITI